MMLYLLAMASPTNPIPTASWTAWARPTFSYQGMYFISSGAPLFTHQYSHAWFDFRNKKDVFANYYQNSVTATRGAPSVLYFARRQVFGLQRRLVGNFLIRLPAAKRSNWLYGLGRAAGTWAD